MTGISIFGLGYVGCVSAACLAKNGHLVVGVDVSSEKVDLINSGVPTIIEKDVDTLVREAVSNGSLRATTNVHDAILASDVSVVCVGTPASKSGHLDLSYIEKTANQIGLALKNKDSYHVVVIRSTVLPGTNKRVESILGEVSGKRAGEDFSVVSNPEFLREGTAVKDYSNPPYTVLGSEDSKAISMMKHVYSDISSPVHVVPVEVAEIIKYINNSFHALKISFANEVGNICKAVGIDSHLAMDLFCKDESLNISRAYLCPGNAYGGSCLPKDLGGLAALAKDFHVEAPVLENIPRSNNAQKGRILELVESSFGKRVSVVGLSFKEGTDDLRYSPSVDLAKQLIGQGYEVSIYDENVYQSKLVGGNKSFIESALPHLSKLIKSDLTDSLVNSDIVVFSHKLKEVDKYIDILKEKEKVLDLVRIPELEKLSNYEGLCW